MMVTMCLLHPAGVVGYGLEVLCCERWSRMARQKGLSKENSDGFARTRVRRPLAVMSASSSARQDSSNAGEGNLFQEDAAKFEQDQRHFEQL